MKKIVGLTVILTIGMLLVLCLEPRAEARLGVSIGFFRPNLEGVNRDLGEVNKEFGTNLKFQEAGLTYSFALESWLSSRSKKRIDISLYQTKTADSFDIIAGWNRIRGDIEAKLIALPIFYTRIYQGASAKGTLSPYLGVGVGTVFTTLIVSRRDKVTHPDGYTEENSWRKELTSIPLAGQILAGLSYRWSYRKGIFLEVRYIASKKAEILDREGGIETSIDWSGLSYRFGLMI